MRTDIHAPSQIISADYEYVAIWTMNIQGFGDSEFMLRERETVQEHMARTGGTYAHVDTTGSCQVCGNWLAIYLVLFYHAKSNTYIHVGVNCATKLEMGFDMKAMAGFKRRCADAREQQAGKRKAIALLGDAGLIDAWDIYTAPAVAHISDCPAYGQNQYGDDNGVENTCNCLFEARWKTSRQFPELTITDIVGKLVKYGSVSEKQLAFVGKLLQQIADRPIVEAQRKAEADAAGPVPVGRVKMTGVVLSIKEVERATRYYGDSGIDTKVLIKLENGSKIYGNRFANVEKGETITFVASVTASKTDTKFGFFKRPATAKTEELIAQEKAAKKLR